MPKVTVLNAWFAAYTAHKNFKDHLDSNEVVFNHAEITGDNITAPSQNEKLEPAEFFQFVKNTAENTYFEILVGEGNIVATIALFPAEKNLRLTILGGTESEDTVKEFTW